MQEAERKPISMLPLEQTHCDMLLATCVRIRTVSLDYVILSLLISILFRSQFKPVHRESIYSSNPFIENPFIENPFIENPFIEISVHAQV